MASVDPYVSNKQHLRMLVNQRNEWYQIYLDTISEAIEVLEILLLISDMILHHDNVDQLSNEPELIDMIDDEGFRDEYLQPARASYAHWSQKDPCLVERDWKDELDIIEDMLSNDGSSNQRTEFIVACLQREQDPETIFINDTVLNSECSKISENNYESWDEQQAVKLCVKDESTTRLVNLGFNLMIIFIEGWNV